MSIGLNMLVSTPCEITVILDALIKLDDDHDYIRIDYGYPGPGFAAGEDLRNSPEVIDFFDAMGLLK